jgi:uncharacterized protein DUF2188
MTRNVIYVVATGRRWSVVRSGSAVALSTHEDRDAAVAVARAIAERENLAVHVFGGRTAPPRGADPERPSPPLS